MKEKHKKETFTFSSCDTEQELIHGLGYMDWNEKFVGKRVGRHPACAGKHLNL
jgi:hypothetical protein